VKKKEGEMRDFIQLPIDFSEFTEGTGGNGKNTEKRVKEKRKNHYRNRKKLAKK